VRFVAAFWVLAYHLLRPWLSSTDAPPMTAWGRDLLAGAPVAVTVFFVLSGFVLTWVYARRDTLDVRAFAAARISRVIPVYLLAILVAVPIGVIVRAKGMVDDGYLSLALVVTATQAWVPDAALQWNPPLWSVSVEVAFYIAFVFLLPRIKDASTRSLVIVAALAWGLSVSCGVAYGALDPDGIGQVRVESRGLWLHVLRFNPIVRFPDLLIGMIAARFFVDGARLHRAAGAGAAVAIALLLASGLVPVPLLHGSLLAPLAAVIVVALATSDGPIARWLSTSTMQRLGETSYALYALHIPVWLWMAALAGRTLADSNAWFTLAVAAVSIAVAVGAHVVFEKPTRDRVRALVAQRSH
jgi:peptidoglycan/LPS O-acetylase OafA/YrhL